MNYPLISEYKDAILSAEDNFSQLTHLRPVLDAMGNPVMSSGNFAVVFKMKDIETDDLYAVKCFTREQKEREERYREIIKVLEQVESPYFVSTQYYDKELFVDTSQSDETEFPVLVMDWVEGVPLDEHMKAIEGSQFKRKLLAKQFQELVCWLLPKHFAHGDLKPDNIIVKEDGGIVLVDYDGMFVPSLRGKEALEMGTPMYRHVGRTLSFFNEYIDDYAAVMLLLLLKVNSISAIDYNTHLTGNSAELFKNFNHLLTNFTIAPLLSAYILVSTFGRIDRQQISCLLSENSDFNSNKESALQDSAREGDTVAMIELGHLYTNGTYVPQSTSKAMQWFLLAKLLGNVDASCGLCKCISENDDFIKNNDTLLSRLEDCKVNFAFCKEGMKLYNDNKYEQAIYWIQKAADKGLSSSKRILGLCYEEGNGVEKDLDKAVYWYQKAADEGNSRAQQRIGWCYKNGIGVQKDHHRAVCYFKRAAEAGESTAQCNLAFCYLNGDGVDQNCEKAVYWWKKAAELENSIGQSNLALCYNKGYGVEKDLEKAVYWWKKVAEAGNSEVQSTLGLCYFMGDGVEKDLEAAVFWFKKAAEAGDSRWQYFLGVYYERGNGVEKDLDKAVYWYQKAAEQGNSDAENNLELCCKRWKINDIVNVNPNEIKGIGECNTGTYSDDGKRFLCYWGTYGEKFKVEDGTEILCDDCFNDLYSESDGHYLETLYLPSTLNRIGNNVFCASITDIICDSLNFYTKNGFLLSSDNKTLYRYFGKEKTVHIPEGIKYIKGGAFSEKDIEKVIIPNTVIHIGDNPFAGCDSLKKIVSNSMRFIIVEDALYDTEEKRLIGCWNYKHSLMKILSGTKILGKNAFFGLKFQIVFIPDSIEVIDESAFYHCFNLNKIAIPSNQYRRIYNLIPSYIKSYEHSTIKCGHGTFLIFK